METRSPSFSIDPHDGSRPSVFRETLMVFLATAHPASSPRSVGSWNPTCRQTRDNEGYFFVFMRI